ncbi:phosphotransferase [Actinophytocola sp.]|uniref:phosphotransferase n=1 Tax=Actinophytocola sp. TaxID=1872138 RepID=UPI00389A27DA
MVDEPVPPGLGAELHRVRPVPTRTLRVSGFPVDTESGLWIEATVADGGGERCQFVGTRITAGFSGAPVLDETGRPVGIVVAGAPQDRDTAWLVPTDTITRHLPQVARWVGPQPTVAEQLSRRVSYDTPGGRLPEYVERTAENTRLRDPTVPERARFCPLHRRGVLHGDIKPENVIQTGNRVTLIDLEAARLIGDRSGPVIGTRSNRVSRAELETHGPTVR